MEKMEQTTNIKLCYNVEVKRLNEKAILPTLGSPYSAGYDLRACVDSPITIPAHSTVLVGTGLSITPPEGYFGAIFARSGLASKQGLRPANCVGVCDYDYTGEYKVALHNDTDADKVVNPQDRIAQLVFLPYINCNFTEVNKLKDFERGTNGFGSTGN